MKNILTILSISFLFVAFNSFKSAQTIDGVIASIRAGNATEIAKYIDNTVEISLPDKSDSYSKSQATMILQNFFNSAGVKGFDVVHKGDNGGNQFAIGTLHTRSGSFRATVFMKSKNGRNAIREITFKPA